MYCGGIVIGNWLLFFDYKFNFQFNFASSMLPIPVKFLGKLIKINMAIHMALLLLLIEVSVVEKFVSLTLYTLSSRDSPPSNKL